MKKLSLEKVKENAVNKALSNVIKGGNLGNVMTTCCPKCGPINPRSIPTIPTISK